MLSEYEIYAIAAALWWLVGFVTAVWHRARAQSRLTVGNLCVGAMVAIAGAMIPVRLLVDRLERSGVLETTIWRGREGDKE
ncbi:hypothetical protein Q3O97_12480 [Ralstonia pseudosolanacearum]|uniref:hypothetical protein n=1 Tax=Ralstonia pseudosolanacearum TaxID=1310165 RepID=UPI0026FD5C26|nr:hypothetical protein [Ralstonia pseudosolanacearum]MDO3616667.1 hypothetical protein [Ralstonia pseudosolanacearum]